MCVVSIGCMQRQRNFGVHLTLQQQLSSAVFGASQTTGLSAGVPAQLAVHHQCLSHCPRTDDGTAVCANVTSSQHFYNVQCCINSLDLISCYNSKARLLLEKQKPKCMHLSRMHAHVCYCNWSLLLSLCAWPRVMHAWWTQVCMDHRAYVQDKWQAAC